MQPREAKSRGVVPVPSSASGTVTQAVMAAAAGVCPVLFLQEEEWASEGKEWVFVLPGCLQ